MLKWVKVKKDAVRSFIRSLNLPEHAGFTSSEFHYKTILRDMTGRSCIQLDRVVGGVSGYTYLLIPDDVIAKSIHSTKSRVIAVEASQVEPVEAEDESVNEDELYRKLGEPQPPHLYHGYDVVRLLVPWVDGFSAFIPQEQTDAV